MPQDNTVAQWEYLGQIYQDSKPATKFVDEISAIKVTLVSSPEKDALYNLFKNVAYVSWDKDWKDFSYEESVEFLPCV